MIVSLVCGAVIGAASMAPVVSYALNGWRRSANGHLTEARIVRRLLRHIDEIEPDAVIGRKRRASWQKHRAAKKAGVK